MASLKTLCNEMELLVQYPEVGLAISDSSTPVPGYLYGEINAITYIDYGNNCKPLVNFLISRLQANTPLVSIKILKLLLHLAKNGHTEMVEEIKYHEIALKEAMSFHGPPDEFHGKEFYENIRKLAKELLEYVFSEAKEISDNTAPPNIPELTGYGSNANTTGLTGFGFSVKSQKTVSEKISDGVTNLVEKLLPSNEKETKDTHLTQLKESLPQYKPLIINKDPSEENKLTFVSDSGTHQKSAPFHQKRLKPRAYKPGKPGGGWDDSEEDEEDDDDAVDQSKENVSKGSTLSFDCIEINKIEIKDNATDWTDEHKIVDSFTINEPLSNINYASVTTLCKKCSSLNCDKILLYILGKLEGKDELPQLRALILVEYLIFHDIIALESLLKILILPLNNLVEKAEDIPHSVKLKAKKVCLIVQNLSKQSQVLTNQFAQTSIKCNS